MDTTMIRKKLTTAIIGGVLMMSANLRASESDDRIEASAKKSYVFENYLKNDSIKVAADGGVVTLTGSVVSESHKAMAERTVESLPGVTTVYNRLEIKGENLGDSTDAWTSARVTSTLSFHRNVNGDTTKVSTKNGHVTLSGEASSAAQKDLTGEYAKDVYGIRDVKNDMTIAKTFRRQDQKTMSEKVSEKVGDVRESVDDTSITAFVKMTLLYHQSTSVLDTTVVTNDGVVTLGGKAKNAAEKDLASKLVRDVHGVKSVNNIMTI